MGCQSTPNVVKIAQDPFFVTQRSAVHCSRLQHKCIELRWGGIQNERHYNTVTQVTRVTACDNEHITVPQKHKWALSQLSQQFALPLPPLGMNCNSLV